ncbi:hypothetical protein GLOTRDRAFT_133052 [Gloeophyllum trabeum ATCC 11539]|uniref:Uncharacterized protein n=1 Tax=Gloeophyllum trabeum (strain ATCC 11539 / FP-39264 / Madison 617) TaxID=670483 RepID=S7RGK1_GLOTA|nr:uncharacterized protein GLOTRDRAFT_133052 [Gloeophyllum trabeum ATCC 11539]EPQ51684.1 hypothetical protein GLOTRDRAFT_133052 [Gloeophyllum trabeum ATCC 11539]
MDKSSWLPRTRAPPLTIGTQRSAHASDPRHSERVGGTHSGALDERVTTCTPWERASGHHLSLACNTPSPSSHLPPASVADEVEEESTASGSRRMLALLHPLLLAHLFRSAVYFGCEGRKGGREFAAGEWD